MTNEHKVALALNRVIAHLPGGGEVRDGQRQMAEAVSDAIDNERHLVVRAGTGTGKSLAYLVPAVLAKKRVVVATATKALQHQLGEKDLPSLTGRIASKFSFAVLKGRSNYLCVQRLRESSEMGVQEELEPSVSPAASSTPMANHGQQARAIAEWARVTTTGDQEELGFEPDTRVWSSFSVTPEECPGAFHCPSGGSCFAEIARAKAAEADVVVVNLHLLGAHIASAGSVLPEHGVLIVDEAHELEEILSRSLGVSISPGRLRAIAALARASSSTPRGARASELDEAALSVMDSAGDVERALEIRKGSRIDIGNDEELARVVELLQARLERLDAAVRKNLTDAEGKESPKSQRALQALSRLRNDVALLVGLSVDQVAWVEFGARPTLEIAPIDIAPVVARELFEKMPVIMTSATVPMNLGTHLGAKRDQTDELDVGSPFHFDKQALLYCAAHLPDRRSASVEEAMIEEILGLMQAAGGRTLALFTSRAVMDRVAAVVRGRLDLPILTQGERAKSALIEALSTEPEMSLFATMGFWQGVDIPGAALSLVIIDRIPFPRPDDPLLQARRDRAGDRAFRVVDLPRAASLLAQGAGRLIRSQNDRGVVAVLDSRLATAGYRWELIRALPPMRRTKNLDEAKAFLREIDIEARRIEQGDGTITVLG
jgi:ATP-dependent DNA helicase DinG